MSRKIDLSKVKYALQVTLRRCDPTRQLNRQSPRVSRAEFGSAIVETNKSNAQILREALAEMSQLSDDELILEHDATPTDLR